jgi:hypothetical protein
MTMATIPKLDVEKLVRVAGVLGGIRAWTENAHPDDLYNKETVDKVYSAVEFSETAILEIVMQQKELIASDG